MTGWGEPAPEPLAIESEATGLEEFLGELMALEGVLMAALFDRSGRVLADAGFSEDSLPDVASLAAGIHAGGARLGEAAGDPGFPRILIQAKRRSVLIVTLPVRAGIPLVLLVVATRSAVNRLRPGLQEISGISPARVPSPASMNDSEAFEASLLECLDQLFPREVGR